MRSMGATLPGHRQGEPVWRVKERCPAHTADSGLAEQELESELSHLPIAMALPVDPQSLLTE